MKTIVSPGHFALIAAMIAARKVSGLTQVDLARVLGCQQSLIARMESGQRRIDAVDLVLWARAVDADAKHFIGVVEEATSFDQNK
jgi:transcriptional regulator with XRE-family HTH domain